MGNESNVQMRKRKIKYGGRKDGYQGQYGYDKNDSGRGA